jgi:orotate phosphoribosyltransferase-like protein
MRNASEERIRHLRERGFTIEGIAVETGWSIATVKRHGRVVFAEERQQRLQEALTVQSMRAEGMSRREVANRLRLNSEQVRYRERMEA